MVRKSKRSLAGSGAKGRPAAGSGSKGRGGKGRAGRQAKVVQRVLQHCSACAQERELERVLQVSLRERWFWRCKSCQAEVARRR